MFIHIEKVVSISIKTFPRFMTLLTGVLFIVNIFTPLAIQMVYTSNTSILGGFGDPPSSITFPTPNMEIPRGVLFWYGLRFDDYFLNNNPGFITGETYWIITFKPLTVILIFIASIISAAVFTVVRYYSKVSRSKCRAEVGSTGLATTLTVAGLSSAASAAVSCPSCGFTAIMNVAMVIVSSSTGSLLGISTLYVNIMNTLLVIGILLNLVILMYVAKKVGI